MTFLSDIEYIFNIYIIGILAFSQLSGWYQPKGQGDNLKYCDILIGEIFRT